jgi:hypothetical protein
LVDFDHGAELPFSRMKLQIDEGIWNGFDFYCFYFKTGLTGLSGIFSPAAMGLSAEGRLILTILLILSNYFL